MNKFVRFACLALLVVLSLCGQTMFASHLRGITLTSAPTSTPGTVQFTFLYSYRASSGCNENTPCQVGDTTSAYIDFGDGNGDSITTTVTSVNSSEDYMISVGTLTHTYSGPGPYTAQYSDCCRLSNLKSGADGNIILATTVYPFSSNHPPVSSMPAILTIQLANTTGFQLIASDPDGDQLSYRLATAEEMFDTPASCLSQQPPGLSIAQNGAVTWDTTRITAAGCGYSVPVAGDIWPAKFIVSDLDANGNVQSSVPVDILLKFVSSSQAPPTLTFSATSPLTVAAGSPVTFTATGDDVTPGSRVMVNVSGMPVGASATNLNQLLTPPTESVFTWTPTTSQAGTYVLTYTATTDTYLQVLGSVTLKVTAAQPPTLTCPATLNGQYLAPLAMPVTVLDPRGEAVSVVWEVDGVTVRTDNLAASASASNLSYSQAFNTLGAHTLKVSATNTDNQTSSCTPAITIAKADQTISFTLPSSVRFGDIDTALAASATSGLPVSFTASGTCTVVNGALHVTAAGSCNVAANQAGNGNYNPATQVAATVIVNKASSTLSGPVIQPTFVIYGQSGSIPVSITGQVSGSGFTAPSGAINYTTTNSASATVASGSLTITNGAISIPVANTLPVGDYTVTANFLGDGNYNAAPALTLQLKIGQLQPTITWPASASITYGTTLSGVLSAQAVYASAPVAGTYRYVIGANAVTPATVLPAGSYSVSVSFTPTDTQTYKVASASATLVVNKAAVAGAVLTSSVNPLVVQNATVLRATVTSPLSVPSGTVTFLDGATPLGTGVLTSGTATLSVSSLAVGTHSITATYSGDTNFLTAASGAVSQSVQDFTLTGSGNTSQMILPGETATYTFTVTPVGGTTLPSAVNITVSGLPSGATSTITPQTVPSGSGGTSVVVTVTAQPQKAMLSTGQKLVPIAFALLLLPFSRRLRRSGKGLRKLTLALMMLFGSAIALMGLAGCGSSNGFFGQPQQSYPITVTATSGNAQRSANITLTVQ